MERLHINKMDTWSRNLNPSRKQWWVGGKTLLRMKRTPLTRNDNWSCWCWNDRIHLKRNTPVKKDWQNNLDDQDGLVFTSEYENTAWKRYGINIWLRSNSNTTTQNKQRIGLQNKPEQTYDRDFVRSFRGGAYTGSIVQHHHVQGSAHDIRSVPESA